MRHTKMSPGINSFTSHAVVILVQVIHHAISLHGVHKSNNSKTYNSRIEIRSVDAKDFQVQTSNSMTFLFSIFMAYAMYAYIKSLLLHSIVEP